MSTLALLERRQGSAHARLTVAGLYTMADSGVIGPEDCVELVEGELVPRAPKSNKHEALKSALAEWLIGAKPRTAALGVEMSLTLDDHTLVEPDLCLHPRMVLPQDVRGPDILLLVEVSDSSISYDVNTKAPLYASHGVREYWVADAHRLELLVHRIPSANGYCEVSRADRNTTVRPSLFDAELVLSRLELPSGLWL